jgi:hypothetical protein
VLFCSTGSIQTITLTVITLNRKYPMKNKSVPSLIGVVLALLFVAFPSSAQATAPVQFVVQYDTGVYVKMQTSTPGATIFYTMGLNDQGWLADPTHNGSSPISPTMIYSGRIPIAYGYTYYFAAVAWTAAGGDSEVTYWEQENP